MFNLKICQPLFTQISSANRPRRGVGEPERETTQRGDRRAARRTTYTMSTPDTVLKAESSSLHNAKSTERIRQMGEAEDDEEDDEDAHRLITATVSTLLRRAGKTLLSLLLAAVYASLVISLIVWTATFVYGTFYFVYAPTRDAHGIPLNFGKQAASYPVCLPYLTVMGMCVLNLFARYAHLNRIAIQVPALKTKCPRLGESVFTHFAGFPTQVIISRSLSWGP